MNWALSKDYWFEHVFAHYCAMFMLEGGGRATVAGRDFAMPGPFVLLARPKMHYRYGPDTSWLERGFVFADHPDPGALKAFPEEPWPIRAPDIVHEQLAMIGRLLNNPAVPGIADQIDLLARAALTASLHGTGEDLGEGPQSRLYAAESWLRTHFAKPIDLGQVVRRFGFSEPTFRRLWRRNFSKSPWQHVIELRLREARRLLQTEPDLTVAEIAARCGFDDQRHFATLFKRRVGKPPTHSRK